MASTWTTSLFTTSPRRWADDKKAKGKLKNYKLKHSSMLTCYSGLLFLLAVFEERKTVHPTDALEMISLSPTARLEWLLGQPNLSAAHATVAKLLQQYEQFLQTTNAAEADLVGIFRDKKKSREHMSSAHQFGDLIFDALTLIGNSNRFHRLLVV